ncbi:MAG: hypothetical protein WC012_08930 [Thiohalomonadaceae bacterium]
MKKIAFAIFVSMGLGTSFSAVAAGETITSGEEITGGVDGNCVLLADDVRLNLSNGVSGAYMCDEGTTTIKVGTCHAAGSRTASISCAVVDHDEDNNPIYNNEGCDGTPNQTINEPDYRGYFASTTGGAVGGIYLGGNCTQDTLNGNWYFN